MASPTQRIVRNKLLRDVRQARSGKDSMERSILSMFAHLGMPVSHPADSTLFEEGKRVDGIYLVHAGQIKLSCSAGQERSMILRVARAGEILGLSAALNGTCHEATAKTLMPCDLTQIPPPAFLGYLKSFTAASTQGLLALARDHRELFLSVRRLALFPLASSRMAQVLICFSHAEARKRKTPRFLMLLNHAELASLIGTSRETVTRILNDFERQGIIARDQSQITILRPAKLASLAN